MSWNYTVHTINRSLEQLAVWYQEFMRKTEQSFQALHQRLVYLEQRAAWSPPSDEQLERVLRKILADKFSDPPVEDVRSPHPLDTGEFFVQTPREDASVPKPITFDIQALMADVAAVPSEKYIQTLQMLENELPEFPRVELNTNAERDTSQDFKDFSRHFNDPKHE